LFFFRIQWQYRTKSIGDLIHCTIILNRKTTFRMAELSETKFLARYIKEKMEDRIGNISIYELESFFNENGWVLYDLDTLVTAFKKWRTKSFEHQHLND
jgi:hypothetical protein